MIYSKEASYPYPVLTNKSEGYHNGIFNLDIELQMNSEEYRFLIHYELSSEFLRELIRKGKAELFFVVQSRDNKFYSLQGENKTVSIPRNRISFNKRTSLQLLIRAKEELSFQDNQDLDEFYDSIKEDMVVPAHSVLGLSNVVIFDGSNKKPFEIFEKKLVPELRSDIAIEIGEETILIKYRSELYQFSTHPESQALNYPYVYMGLQKALIKMIQDEADEKDGEVLYIDEMDPPSNGLNFKLYNLLKSKFVEELSMSNIDEVIYQISDRMIEKFVVAIGGMGENGN